MYGFLMVLFVVLSVFLALFVLIQQGKGDLGLGSMGGNQMLFGGSGGQTFFERATWIMGALFIFGSLGLSILRSKEQRRSALDGVAVVQKNKSVPLPSKNLPSVDDEKEESLASNVATSEQGSAQAEA